MDQYKATSYIVHSVVKKDKPNYGGKKQSDSRSLWQGLRTITDYKQQASTMMNADTSLVHQWRQGANPHEAHRDESFQ